MKTSGAHVDADDWSNSKTYLQRLLVNVEGDCPGVDENILFHIQFEPAGRD